MPEKRQGDAVSDKHVSGNHSMYSGIEGIQETVPVLAFRKAQECPVCSPQLPLHHIYCVLGAGLDFPHM